MLQFSEIPCSVLACLEIMARSAKGILQAEDQGVDPTKTVMIGAFLLAYDAPILKRNMFTRYHKATKAIRNHERI